MKHINKSSSLYVVALGLLLHSVARCEQSTPVVDEAQIIARVKAMGDGATVDDVMREVSKLPKKSKESPANDYEKVRLIEKINTDAAQRALFEIAMGRRKDNDCHVAAVNSYVRVLPDKRSATNLLQSMDAAVLHSALLGLQGCKVDDDLMEWIKPRLLSSDIHIRVSAINVIAASSEPCAERIVGMVVDSMRNLEHFSGATNIIPVSLIYANFSGLFNFETELSRAHAIYAAKLAAFPAGSLEKFTPTEAGNIRDAVLIARAKQMDALLKPEMKRIFQESPLASLRAMALKAFGNIATQADLPFLRDIVANDPSYFKAFGEIRGRLEVENLSTEKCYPFRQIAQRFIWKLAPTHSGQATPAQSGQGLDIFEGERNQ